MNFSLKKDIIFKSIQTTSTKFWQKDFVFCASELSEWCIGRQIDSFVTFMTLFQLHETDL